MAKYDFECRQCKIVIEIERKMNEKKEIRCPKCGTFMERTYQTNAFILKGEGFYKEGYSGK